MDRLSELAEKYGSDKTPSLYHNYTPFYDSLLRYRDVKRVLEIGIGTVECMGHVKDYKPGASLRMWRDYFPTAEIFALDNEMSVLEGLKNEPRIYPVFCDQSDQGDLIDIVRRLGGLQFDLIVDDGSHQVAHQALTANTFIPKLLSRQGVYIIEDVMWRKDLYALLPWPAEVRLFDLRRSPDDCLFVIEGGDIY
jgi:hypothetical protein